MSAAPEGSPERRFARAQLFRLARAAKRLGLSYREWEEAMEDRVSKVSKRDLEAIYRLVWEGNFGG